MSVGVFDIHMWMNHLGSISQKMLDKPKRLAEHHELYYPDGTSAVPSSYLGEDYWIPCRDTAWREDRSHSQTMVHTVTVHYMIALLFSASLFAFSLMPK